MVFVFGSFSHCELNHFGEDFFQAYKRLNKKIHTKLNSIRDEIGKRGRIIMVARIPRICSEKRPKIVPVSFAVVENFLRRRSIQVGDKVMPYDDKAVVRVTKKIIYYRVRVDLWV